MPKVRIRGHRRRRKPEGSTNWPATGAIMYLSSMTPEEKLDFLWAHPEVEGRYMGMAVTDAERYYLPKGYLWDDDELPPLTEEQRLCVVNEAMHALRLSRQYEGKLTQDEFDYARIILEELEASC